MHEEHPAESLPTRVSETLKARIEAAVAKALEQWEAGEDPEDTLRGLADCLLDMVKGPGTPCPSQVSCQTVYRRTLEEWADELDEEAQTDALEAAVTAVGTDQVLRRLADALETIADDDSPIGLSIAHGEGNGGRSRLRHLAAALRGFAAGPPLVST